MTDMVENGSSAGAWALPPNESHDEFLELCAIATTGSLSAEERERLEQHLSSCAACRQAVAQYEALIVQAIPALAPDPVIENDEDAHPNWSPEQAEATFFSRLDGEHGESQDVTRKPGPLVESGETLKTPYPAGDALWRHMWWQFAAGLLLVVALGFSVYRIGIRRGAEITRRVPSIPPAERSHAEPPPSQQANTPSLTSDGTERRDTQIAQLRAQLVDRSKEIASLKEHQAQIEKDLNDRETDRTRLTQDRADLTHQLEIAQTNLQNVRQQLDSATGKGSEDATRMRALEAKVDELTDAMHVRDQDIAREQELLDHDRDIRELMGSRDLYIAEVYDVAKTGDTQKPFGRVFYTKGKSLIFYAYDLDQQPGIKNASSFQAWGRRGPDREQAVNLGVFYQDNANKKRWVLKSSNAKTLAQIDAVFVTVEPNGGSLHPSGKPLLFAYLRIEPNHP